MMKYDKESFAETDNQSSKISVQELQSIALKHQDKIDCMNNELSAMLKKYSQPAINKSDLELEGRRGWLNKNTDISQLERKIAQENKEYIAALKEQEAKITPKFYEIWKINTMVYEMERLNTWRESISSLNDKLVNEKEHYLKMPLAKHFIDNYVKEQLAEQENNQKRVQEINQKRESLSDQRKEIAKINFTASQIKNIDAKITINGNVNNLKNIVLQGDKIKSQLLKIQLNKNTLSKPHGVERHR